MKAHNESLQDKSEPALEPEPKSEPGTQPVYAICSCGFDKIAADRLADEVAALVVNHHLDSRSAVADALLDYREPPRTPRSDRIADLEAELTALRTQMTNSRHTFTRSMPNCTPRRSWNSNPGGGSMTSQNANGSLFLDVDRKVWELIEAQSGADNPIPDLVLSALFRRIEILDSRIRTASEVVHRAHGGNTLANISLCPHPDCWALHHD